MIKNIKGFTMVELMVVMTIMMVLTAIGVVSYQQASIKSRDSRRAADLEKIRIALELYRQEVGGTYPANSTVMTSLLVPKYIQMMPSDPKADRNYQFINLLNGYGYALLAGMESLGSTTTTDVTQNCGALTCNYEVKNP